MSQKTMDGLLLFLAASPSPFHATRNLAALFLEAGFEQIDEYNAWNIHAGGCYFYTRSDASIVAFRLGANLVESGARLVGAHTDSPCLKVKPSPELNNKGYSRLGIEVYGGALLNPWFDRDLSLAGKVTGLNESGDLISALVDFEKAIAIVPSLAIHLNREANKNKTVNPQTEMNALLSLADSKFSFRDLLFTQANLQNPECNFSEILDFNISFYDVQQPSVIGLHDEFISSARLDNLLSCYMGAQSLIGSESTQTAVLVCNDHEEIGSRSEVGAQGTMLNDLFARLLPDPADRQRALRHSMMLSVDNAHGIHPNYDDRHDSNHGPIINAGPVIKFDADQSYATSSETSAFVRWLSTQGETLSLQSFVTRADSRCGSTIGPITASNLGVKTVDIGNPQFAMHSCREMAGVKDVYTMCCLLERFFLSKKVSISQN